MALEFDTRCESLGNLRPRIIRELFHAQRDTLVLRIHFEDQYFDVLALLNHFRRMLDALGPAHVGNVDESVDSSLDFHESTERSQVPDRTGQLRTRWVLYRQCEPRVFLDLLHTERDLLVVRIDLEHHDFDLFRDHNDFRGMSDIACPRHL